MLMSLDTLEREVEIGALRLNWQTRANGCGHEHNISQLDQIEWERINGGNIHKHFTTFQPDLEAFQNPNWNTKSGKDQTVWKLNGVRIYT